MKISLTEITDQIGYELGCSLQGLGVVVAADSRQMDLVDHDQVRGIIRAVDRPDQQPSRLHDLEQVWERARASHTRKRRSLGRYG